jgi:hypothetical protein
MLGKFLILAALNNSGEGVIPPTPEEPVVENVGDPTWILKGLLDSLSSGFTLLPTSSNLTNTYIPLIPLSSADRGPVFLTKIVTESGLVSWSKKLDPTEPTLRAFQNGLVHTSSSGTFITIQEVVKNSTTYTPRQFIQIVSKLNDDGTVAWSRGFALDNNRDDFPIITDIISNVDGAVFTIGTQGRDYLTSPSGDIIVVKHGPNGALRWQFWYNLNYEASPSAATIGEDKDVWIACNSKDGSDIYSCTLLQIGPDGDFIESYKINNFEISKIHIDLDNKLYLIGKESNDNGITDCLIKINPTGDPWVIEWQKRIDQSLYSITESSDKIILSAERTGDGDDPWISLIPFSKDGTIESPIDVLVNENEEQGRLPRVFADGNNNLILSCVNPNSSSGKVVYEPYITKLPDDGSKRGEYDGDFGSIFIKIGEDITTTNSTVTIETVNVNKSNANLKEALKLYTISPSDVEFVKGNI